MSGGALAASHYLINSTRQINPKVLKKLKGRTGPRGAIGAEGPQGPLGASGSRGPLGPQGPEGLSDLSSLPSGASESGVFGMAINNSEESGRFAQTVKLGPGLKAGLDGEHVFYFAFLGNNLHCAGPGQADRGYLCVYSSGSSGLAETEPEILNPELPPLTKGAGQHGFILRWTVKEKEKAASDFGTYTVTGN